MAYNEFAYFYDEFNGEADYDALYEQIRQELNAHDIRRLDRAALAHSYSRRRP